MPDFNVRSDSVNVEHIMEQIRARIREKRGVDYTEEQIRELAAVKLEKFLDPRGVRSDLLDQFRKAMRESEPPAPPNYSFEADTLFDSHRGVIRFFRQLFHPLLKLFLFNPNPLIQALNIQARLNTINAQHETSRRGMDQLYYELIHNLVVELTRTGIEVKNLKMRVESLTGRLEFNERRARALESAVVYRPASDERPPRPPQQQQPPAPPAPIPQVQTPQAQAPVPQQTAQTPAGVPGEGPGQRSRRRRRRRGRRGGGAVAAQFGSASAAPGSDAGPSGSAFAAPASEAASAGEADEGSGGASESEDLGHLADDGGPTEPGSGPDPDAQ
jgi:hypothetical protein